MAELTQEQAHIKKETEEWYNKQRQGQITKVNNIAVTPNQAKKIKEILANREQESPEELSEKEFDEFKNLIKNEAKEELEREQSGEGTLPASKDLKQKEHNNSNNKREFDTYEEMLDYCRTNDRESYEKLKNKAFRGILGNNWTWKDEFVKGEDGVERSLIGRTIHKMNEECRRKARGE